MIEYIDKRGQGGNDPMRADRLVSIVLLLQAHGRLTARDLALRLEVSERTIHRDMEALSGSGVPVVAERGNGGGWALMDGYQTSLTGLNQGEVQALFLTQPDRLLRDLGLHQASETALMKLLAVLPAMFRQRADFVRQRILIDPSGWKRPGESVSCLSVLQDAVLQERKLRFTYRRGDGTETERLADPLGLVAKGSVWYLIAAVDGEVRTYRASRIGDAAVIPEPFRRPPDFGLAAFWEQSQAEFVENLPRYMVTLRAAPAILHRLGWAGRWARVEQVGAVDGTGWAPVTVRCESIREAVEYVLGFGPDIEVVAPMELRDVVIERAGAVLALYNAKETPASP